MHLVKAKRGPCRASTQSLLDCTCAISVKLIWLTSSLLKIRIRVNESLAITCLLILHLEAQPVLLNYKTLEYFLFSRIQSIITIRVQFRISKYRISIIYRSCCITSSKCFRYSIYRYRISYRIRRPLCISRLFRKQQS